MPDSLAVSWSLATLDGHQYVDTRWDFAVQGGSFGAADADGLLAAIDEAVRRRLPLVTRLRSGGTRLTEGMHALVGIPRIVLAMQALHEARLPHIAVCDHPTTGGIWVALGSVADIRIAVSGATVAFSGPRIAQAMTGRGFTAGSDTAEASWEAGLIDSLVTPEAVAAELTVVLGIFSASSTTSITPTTPAVATPPDIDGWSHVQQTRAADRPTGESLLDELLGSNSVLLRGGDGTVAAAIGRIGVHRCVVVALAAQRATRPTPAGFRLLTRAAKLADRLDLALLTLVDTPGADPHTELDGLAAAIAEAMTAVLDCRAPTISLVHGEGGSGGALAAAVTDIVGIGEHGYFAALGPEGAAAALRRDVAEATTAMRVTPRELRATGFADATVSTGKESAWLMNMVSQLRGEDEPLRLARRSQRWSGPVSDS